jgi:uncharacterized protein (TIRG00374 family)
LAIGILLFSLLIYFVDWRQTIDHFHNIALAPVVFALILLSLNIPVSSFKWRFLLFTQGFKLSLWRLTRCYWISTFFGNYLPTSVGGDVVRLVMMKDLGHQAQVAASIVWERITGFVVLLALSALGLSMRPHYFKAGYLLPFLWLAVGIGVAAFLCLLFFGDQISSILKRLLKVKKGFWGRILQKLLKVADSLAYFQKKKKEILFAMILSVPFYIFIVVFNYLILISVGSNIPLIEVCFIAPIVLLVSFLPISLNGIGVAEGAYVLFYAQAGLLPSQGLAAAVIRRVIHLLVSLVGGALWIRHRSETKR